MNYPELLKPPPTESTESWFQKVADQVLLRSVWQIGGERHRFTEIEFYYYKDDSHADSFAHCDPLQKLMGRWYFHRKGGTYKSGSFKGLDLSFGDDEAFGGILIRGIERADGTLIDGPCLCVNYLLEKTGYDKIKGLDDILQEYHFWDTSGPSWIEEADTAGKTIYQTPRIGLTLKRELPQMVKYLFSPYRYINEPKRIKKGKILLVLELLKDGLSREEIREITNSPMKTITNYEVAFQRGRDSDVGLAPFVGKSWKPEELAEAYGAWVSSTDR